MTRTATKVENARAGSPAAGAKTGMTGAERPPYLAALGVSLIVLAGYVWTLGPTVTFWDAGEFIAASKILGIPHPPGTPLFVMMAHVWSAIVRIGEYAYRTNLMTAVFSAASSGLLFLLIHEAMRRGVRKSERDPIYTMGGAAAAALVGAFVFTVWQNSNETEVYMVATFSIAAMAWLAMVWRRHRGTSRGAHILLLIVYILAVSVGNHLLSLLAGPGLIVYFWHVMRTDPLENEKDRQVEFAQATVLAGTWAMLVGVGLGNLTLMVVGGVVFAAAAVYAATVGALRFALAVLGIGAIGVSTYMFLYIRAGLDPFINEADPSTFDSLLAVIRREQYPPRSPIDNPIYPSGPNNPGRTLSLMLLQLANYAQYFDWQWANGLAATKPVFAGARIPFTLIAISAGVVGARTLYEHDRSAFWLLMGFFLVTGIGLVGYMNFKPGFSLGFDKFPEQSMHEVRERDYFFVVSFQVWGLFVGVGLARLYRNLRRWLAADGLDPGKTRYAAAVLGLALLPFVLNFKAASRAHGPEATLARDFAFDLLQSVEPYGIVFTNGDNDTFPLWWAQEVAGIRQDVSVVNLSLGNTDWYLRQLRDNPVRKFDPEASPWWADLAPDSVPPPLHNWTDQEINQLVPQILPRDFSFRAGLVSAKFPSGSPLYVKDVLILKLIQDNWDKRPIYFSITSGSDSWGAFRTALTQEALVLKLHAAQPADTSRLSQGLLGVPLDVPRTDTLANQIYRYAGLFEADSLDLDPTNRNIAANLALPFISLGQAAQLKGLDQASLESYRKGYHLSPTRQLAQVIAMVEQAVANPALFGDTALTGSDSVRDSSR